MDSRTKRPWTKPPTFNTPLTRPSGGQPFPVDKTPRTKITPDNPSPPPTKTSSNKKK